MSTNYNQLLKDLEIGSVYVKILICFLGCTFMLYPFLFYFTHFFRELSVYEQIFFTLGSSALYTGIGIPLSAISFRYPAFYYAPLLLLTATVCLRLSASSWLVLCIKNDTVMLFTVLRISNLRYRRNNINF